MSVDRVATNNQSQFMLNQIDRANVALQDAQTQVSSGKVATDYAGYGDKVSMMEAARSAGNRVTAYQTATKLALTQTDLQDTQISSLADLAGQLRDALTTAVADGSGDTLMTTVQSIFDSASQILNSKDSNGNYIYSGGKSDTPPFNLNSLSDLGSLTDISKAFDNGTLKSSVRVGDGETIQIGQLASDMGSDLMTSLKSVVDYVNANGDLGSTLTGAQSDFLTSQIVSAKTAASNINNIAAANGSTYSRLQDASDKQGTQSTLYAGFVSDIQDVDMPTAISKLNQSQVALQAALEVTSQLQQVSLLNYLK